ncbi:MAG: glucokinase [Methylocystis sp.]
MRLGSTRSLPTSAGGDQHCRPSPGTGFGVAEILRRGGHSHVIETEGGHIDFAPLDPAQGLDSQTAARAAPRVSVERIGRPFVAEPLHALLDMIWNDGVADVAV